MIRYGGIFIKNDGKIKTNRKFLKVLLIGVMIVRNV